MFFSLSPCAHAVDSYFCVSEVAGGIEFNKATQKWRGTRFAATQKFILGKPTPTDSMLTPNSIWVVKEMGGMDYPSFGCSKNIDEFGFLYCDGLTGAFRFNVRTRRFLMFHMIGYITGNEQAEGGDDTPAVTAGTCTSFAQ